MNTLKLAFLFAALVLVISTPVYASEEPNNPVMIENTTSVSALIDSHFYSLAKTAKVDATQRNLLGSWSPDGSILLIRASINQLGDVGLSAVYVLNLNFAFFT